MIDYITTTATEPGSNYAPATAAAVGDTFRRRPRGTTAPQVRPLI